MHGPFCSLWSARLYNIFPHYPTKGTIFGEGWGGRELLNIQHVFRVSLQRLSVTFHCVAVQYNINTCLKPTNCTILCNLLVLNKYCLSVTFLILRGTERDMIKIVYWCFQICLVTLIKIL